jgi:murein DD-endopeptidase / murein LD-carboxypeptidase
LQNNPVDMVQTCFQIRWRHILLFLAVYLLLVGACSRRVHPERSGRDIDTRRGDRGVAIDRERQRSGENDPGLTAEGDLYPEVIFAAPYFHNIESRAEERRLTGFLEGGFGKRLDSNDASPRDIITTAYEYLGVRHCMGGRTKRCIDCSGLLMAVFGEHGISLPHSSEEQARYGRILAAGERLMEGDLVFFVRSYRTNRFITHSGIYVGNNSFIHASSSSGVVVTPMDNSFWDQRFVFATRVF